MAVSWPVERKKIMPLDNLDKKIITHLQEDGLATNAGIARLVGVSEETVRRRLKQMRTDGAITFAAIPNAKMLGFHTQAIIGICAEPARLDHVSQALVDLESVESVHVTTGKYSIFARVLVENPDRLLDLISNEIGQVAGIESIETFVTLDVKKRPYINNLKS